ncbi:hypothetical protein Raf01_90960 [Rugosimonospora africana]|uniref:Uncharacterized protein n=1 Tax=Rugosimonospora africana TaxID=556532 RepID=A0A8J3R343_9ACTN|nr:hypothetical protein Raf01_90960 [Rugosimonospora africana]
MRFSAAHCLWLAPVLRRDCRTVAAVNREQTRTPASGRFHLRAPGPAGPRRLVVDEARLRLRDGEGAGFLFRMSRAGRKRNADLTVITQDDVADVPGTELGRAVVSNAAQILLRQAPQAIDAVGDAFGLTAGKRRVLPPVPATGWWSAAPTAHRSRLSFHWPTISWCYFSWSRRKSAKLRWEF